MANFFQEKGNAIEFWMNGINYLTDLQIKGISRKKLVCSRILDNGLKLVYFKGVRHRSSKLLREIGMSVFSLLTGLKLLGMKEVDAVILSMPPVSNFVAICARIKNIPLIADVEDLWPLFLKESGIKNKAVLKYYELQANSIYKHSSGIEAVSDGMLDYVKRIINCKNKMCWVAPLGVNLEEYDTVDKADLSKYKWQDDFKIMYIGACGRANDLVSVMKTAKEFIKINITIKGRPISFICIGDGNYKSELLKVHKKLGLKNFYFEDAISSHEVSMYLKEADVCFTNLRRLESFKLVRPNKLFQYMAASKPIICGIWGEASDIISESRSGICVDFTNHFEAAKKIQVFIQQDLDSFGKNGNEYIRRTGDRKVIFEDFYQKVLKIIKLKK